MDLTRIKMRLDSALRLEHSGSVTGAQVQAVAKPLIEAFEGLNKEIVSLEKRVSRLETQPQSQHSQPRKSE